MNRILIVEDESRIASFIDKGLKKNGFQTAIAIDGEQALRMISQDNFDLLLLDVGLPIKDGWTVLAELRHQGQQIPVIIVTARDENAKKNLADDYITKPFQFQDLLKCIHNHL